MWIDGDALGKQIAATVRDFLSRATASTNARLDAMAEQIKKIPAGEPGKDVDPDQVRAMVAAAVDAIPRPKDGDPGKDVDPEEIAALIDTQVKAAVAALPAPKDGTSVTVQDVAPLIDEMVKAAVAALSAAKSGKGVDQEFIKSMVLEAVSSLPAPKDGKDADPEQIRSMVAHAVAEIPRPKDGADGKSFTIDDVSHFLEASVAKWALDFERRAQDTLQRAIDRMPAPKDGVDGNDGFSLDEFDMTMDEDGRTLNFTFRRGDLVVERSFTLPVVIDRGVFRDNSPYQKGDGVTWAGAFWIAQKDAPGKPSDGDGWRLAVKRGRDGKDATPGKAAAVEPVRLG